MVVHKFTTHYGNAFSGDGSDLERMIRYVRQDLRFKLKHQEVYTNFIKVNTKTTLSNVLKCAKETHADLQACPALVSEPNDMRINSLPPLHKHIIYLKMSDRQQKLYDSYQTTSKTIMIDERNLAPLMNHPDLFDSKIQTRKIHESSKVAAAYNIIQWCKKRNCS
jgi:hypothetical protein